jgi:hypothetical protein
MITLLIEHDITVDAMVSDRFTWRDAADQPRVAVLAHNDGQTGPGGTRGGELREFRYETAGGTRIVRASGSFASGFGYVVSHRSEGTTGIADDDSPQFTGQFQRVFEGRHHAIFRFTQLYPRYSKTTAMPPNTLYNVPVTMDWVFSTGRDHPRGRSPGIFPMSRWTRWNRTRARPTASCCSTGPRPKARTA